MYAIPANQNGTQLTSGLVSSGPNRTNANEDSTIVPWQRRFNVFASAEQRLADNVKVFAEGLYGWRWVQSISPPYAATLTVPVANAFYKDPLGTGGPVEVLYNFGDDVGPLVTHGRVKGGQSTLGADWQFREDWSLSGYVGYAFETQDMTEDGLVDLTAVNNALLIGKDDAADAFNPFGAGAGNTSPGVIDGIRSSGHWRFDSAYDYGNMAFRGKLFELMGNPWTAIMGGEYRRQTFDARADPVNLIASAPAGISVRRTGSLFAQVDGVLLRGDSTDAHVHRLTLSVGIRRDTFSPTGQVNAPQLSMTFIPLSGFTVYGNWAKWVRPPNLPDLNENSNLAAILPLPDASSKVGFSNVLVETGGNSTLRPETATGVNVGVRWQSTDHPNRAVLLNYFHVSVADHIDEVQSLPMDVLSDPLYTGFVYRSYTSAQRRDACSNGVVVGGTAACLNAPISALVDLRTQNTSSLVASGVDAWGKYGVDSPAGPFNFDLNATYFFRYAKSQAPTPSAPVVSVLNTTHQPLRFRWRGTAKWSPKRFFASTAINFQGHYTDNGVIPDRSVRTWVTFDVAAGVGFGTDALLGDPDTRLTVSALNVFGSNPPVVFSTNLVAYDQENSTLVGRRVGLSLEHHW